LTEPREEVVVEEKVEEVVGVVKSEVVEGEEAVKEEGEVVSKEEVVVKEEVAVKAEIPEEKEEEPLTEAVLFAYCYL